MRRFALIIESSDVEGYTDLPGARDDARNWVDFLKSNLGGSWSDSEIRVLHKPYGSDVQNYLEQHKDDYCFVAFSGHGCHSEKLNQTYAVLNEIYKKFPIEKLKPVGTRGTLVFDACRWTEWEKQAALGSKSTTKMLTTGSAAREIRLERKSIKFSTMVSSYEAYKWLSKLDASLSGVLAMYSCSIGEDAGECGVENPADGGVYTTSLLGATKAWSEKSTLAKIYTTKDAHDAAVEYMSSAFTQQHYKYDPSDLEFPFAVKS